MHKEHIYAFHSHILLIGWLLYLSTIIMIFVAHVVMYSFLNFGLFLPSWKFFMWYTFYILLQFLRFLRRVEGVESARKYFLEARKSPSCTYHVYIAFATMAFCLDKDPKVGLWSILKKCFSFFDKLIVKDVVVVQSSSEHPPILFYS